MELRDYWRVFKRRAWIPIVLAVAAVLTAGAVVYLSPPSYVATATALARAAGTGSPPISFTQAATSNTVAVGVIEKLGLKDTVEDLTKRIHVVSAGNNLYRITVNDPNGPQAARIANEVAQEATALFLQLNTQTVNKSADPAVLKARDALEQQYASAAAARVKFELQHPNALTSKDVNVVVQYLQLHTQEDAAGAAYRAALDQVSRNQLTGFELLTIYDARVLDQAAAKPDTGGRMVEILSAAILALLLGIGLIFLLEYLDNAVREPDVAEEIVGAPVIGIIPRASPHSLRAAKGGV